MGSYLTISHKKLEMKPKKCRTRKYNIKFIKLIKQKKEGKLVKYIVEPFRFCVFPVNPMNAMRFCDEAYMQLILVIKKSNQMDQ